MICSCGSWIDVRSVSLLLFCLLLSLSLSLSLSIYCLRGLMLYWSNVAVLIVGEPNRSLAMLWFNKKCWAHTLSCLLSFVSSFIFFFPLWQVRSYPVFNFRTKYELPLRTIEVDRIILSNSKTRHSTPSTIETGQIIPLIQSGVVLGPRGSPVSIF